MRDFFKKIIEYYRECVKTESTLERYFKLGGAGQQECLINKIPRDILIYNKINDNSEFVLSDDESKHFLNYAKTSKKDVFYGYPLYMKRYKGDICVLPLFSIKLKAQTKGENVIISKDDVTIRCNIQAFDELGCDSLELLQEKIDSAYNEIENLAD